MSLRARLLTVLALIVAVYIAAAMVVVDIQRDLLVDQVDQQLSALPPLGPPGSDPVSLTTEPAETTEAPRLQTNTEFSAVYIAQVANDDVIAPIFAGGLLDTVPGVEQAIDNTQGAMGITTIAAVGGPERFRALVAPKPDGSGWIVSAVSLKKTDAAIARLKRTLWIAGVAIAVVLGLAGFWVYRLGLRPIARVTAAAEAITAGDRRHRLTVRDQRTEAGKLGHAFNVMLDERDRDDARLRQFVADASHELRTPLTSIRGYLDLYRGGAFREQGELDDVVRRLSAESARMHGLVEDLLELASLDEGRPLHRDEIDLTQLLRDAAQDANAVQPERSIAVESADGLTLTGDRGLVTQLVNILVANARVHTPVTAAITLSAKQEGDQVEIAVADTGAGLDPETAARVFDRFWRREAGRARAKQGGAGLGLSIARSITEAHGGTITLTTTPGVGSTFTIRVPRDAGDAGDRGPEAPR
jgi:two-component system OmpR family sensor kinase